MKKIKFRGKRLDNGELIYGDILHYGKYETCIRSYLFPDKNSFSTLPVYSDSVAQFVGYDQDGEEIYSDDEVINVRGTVMPFSLVMISFSELGGSFKNLKVKR